ncbi:putative telomere length and silencing protein [Helianthus annuus]|nr:putative telomere length and silencing protein [Helianthus annuus]
MKKNKNFRKRSIAEVEDDNDMQLKYIEQELAKKKGKNIDVTDQVENDIKHAEDELYKIPEHLKVIYWLHNIPSLLLICS